MEKRNTMNTIVMSPENIKEQITIDDILNLVYVSLEERGYNPIDQISGYLLSGDPTYITSHNNARGFIKQLDREDIVEELVRKYLNKEEELDDEFQPEEEYEEED